jgi:TPR repeat protein
MARMLLIAGLLAALAGPSGPALAQSPGELCDRLAASPDDPMRVGDGVKYDDLDPAAAEPACRQAVEDAPEVARYRYQLGRVLDARDELDAARGLYESAAEGGHAIALVNLGLLYENGAGVARDYARAADYYRRASELGVGVGTWNLANLTDQGLGVAEDPAEAARLFRIGVQNGDPFASAELGWLHAVGRGVDRDEVQAEFLFRQAMAGGDADAAADARNYLAYMWALAGRNLAEAEGLIDAAMAARPEVDAYIDTLALIHFRLGRFAEAAEAMGRAIAIDPDFSPYHARLGDIYAALGRAQDARAEWQMALDLPEPSFFDPEWDRAALIRKLAGTR